MNWDFVIKLWSPVSSIIYYLVFEIVRRFCLIRYWEYNLLSSIKHPFIYTVSVIWTNSCHYLSTWFFELLLVSIWKKIWSLLLFWGKIYLHILTNSVCGKWTNDWPPAKHKQKQWSCATLNFDKWTCKLF